MKRTILTAAIASLFGASLVVAEDAQVQTASDRVGLFNVPLACRAAPEIGCGSRAKPALLELQRQPGIAEAWLNRAGTVLAVVWKKDCNCESRVKAVQSILEKNGVSATALAGDNREAELKDFASRHDWYHGSEVDNLTKQEAAIIAASWVHRVERMVTLSDANAKALEADLTQVISEGVIANREEKPEFTQELLKVASKDLDEKGVAAFQEAVAKGCRPQPEDNEGTKNRTPDCCSIKAT